LTNAAERLAASPDQSSLEAARAAWIAAAEAANRVRCFQGGPMLDRDCTALFYYPRTSPPGIEAVISSSRAINQALLDDLGAGEKGLYALEYLLFGHKGFPGMEKPNAPFVLEMLSAKESGRRRAFLVAAAGDLAAKAGQLAGDWASTAETGAGAKLAGAGQDGVNLLVNQLAHAVEDAHGRHLNFVMVLPQPIAQQIYRIQGGPSGSSLAVTIAFLEGARRCYRGEGGPGLAEAVQQVNAPLAKRISDQFDETIAATRAIGAPLDDAVVNNHAALQAACDKAHALEILLKVDLVSALGVTLTFSSVDGD
jgi:predicted lipoprotein